MLESSVCRCRSRLMGHALSPSDAEADKARIGCTNRCTDNTQDCWNAVPQRSALSESYASDVALDVPLFQISELKLAAKRLESGKSPGPGGIPNEVLRATIREKPQLILNLFNTGLERGHFPKQWKRQKWFSYRRAKARIPRQHFLGGRCACSTPRANCMRGWFSTACRVKERRLSSRSRKCRKE